MAPPNDIPPKELRALLTADAWRVIAESQALSARELDIVQATFNDLPSKAIAQQLGLKAGTVRTYVHRIFRKAKVKDHIGLIEQLIALAMVHRAKNPNEKQAPG